MAEKNILENKVNPILAAPQETDEERRQREENERISQRAQAISNLVKSETHGTELSNTDKGTLGILPKDTSIERNFDPNEILSPKKTQQEAEEWLNSYWAKQIEAEKNRHLNNIESDRIGKTLGDLGHIIGDMIQASGGAVVTPRDIQKKYDSLSAEQQKAYDNYFARMDALRKQVEAREQAEKDAERDAKERRALVEYNARQAAQLQQNKQFYEALQKQQDHEYKMEEIQETNKGRKQVANINGYYKGKQETPTQPEMYDFGNYRVNIPASEIRNRYLAALNYILENDKDGKYLTLDVSKLKLENIKDLVLLYQYGKDAEAIASILNGNYEETEGGM